MATILDVIPDVLLTIMGLLGLVRAKGYRDAFSAAAALFGVEEERLYSDVELFIEQHWEDIFAALDVHARGRQYFVGEAAARRPHSLLIEAACRLRGAQLTIWDMERHRCDLYGHHGPMFTAAIEGGQFIALIGDPLVPWYEGVARETEPGTSSMGEEWPRTMQPVQIALKEVVLVPQDGPLPHNTDELPREKSSERPIASEERRPAEQQSERDTVPAEGVNEGAQWVEQLEARYRAMLRPRARGNAPGERLPRKRAAKAQPDFRPADISALPAHMAAELVAPITPPYIVRNNKILCRLAHCGVADREFETVAAWRKHVALARSHLEDAFCGTCGHHLIVPPGIDGANVKAYITAHKKERCIGASKTTLRQRRAQMAWLDGLMRTTSHILLPDMEQQAKAPGEAEPCPSVVRRKRQYDMEEARRADICCAYLKRFKAAEPGLMDEIATEYQLQLP